jgi:hypothetical protein
MHARIKPAHDFHRSRQNRNLEERAVQGASRHECRDGHFALNLFRAAAALVQKNKEQDHGPTLQMTSTLLSPNSGFTHAWRGGAA